MEWKMISLHTYSHRVSFGDCDPAGIVYYPNLFKWVDTTFHDWIGVFGGHAHLCKALGATGLGLMDAQAQFRAPLHDRDQFSVAITGLEWTSRALSVSYEGRLGDRLAFAARETRGVFVQQQGKLTAAPIQALRDVIERHDQS